METGTLYLPCTLEVLDLSFVDSGYNKMVGKLNEVLPKLPSLAMVKINGLRNDWNGSSKAALSLPPECKFEAEIETKPEADNDAASPHSDSNEEDKGGYLEVENSETEMESEEESEEEEWYDDDDSD